MACSSSTSSLGIGWMTPPRGGTSLTGIKPLRQFPRYYPRPSQRRGSRDTQDLHTSSVMKDQLEAHFATKVFEWVPYMAHYYLDRTDLQSQEAESIASGDINALGIRYVGTKQAG